MTSATVPAAASPTNELAAINQINAAVQQLQDQLQSRQELIEQQRAEIARLQDKIEHLLDTLEHFYKLHGLQARPITDDDIKELDQHGITSDRFWELVDRRPE
jgi:uncharacterized protein YutE (UPF0331/DUF86 family)